MNLFEDPSNIELSEEPVGPGATILRSFAIGEETEILSGLSDVVSKAPFRHMITPGGFRMSVAMTNCGALGWVAISRCAASASTFAADRSIERVAQLIAGSFRTVDDSRRYFRVLGTVQCLRVIDTHFWVGIGQANPIELENSGHLRDGESYIAKLLLRIFSGRFCSGVMVVSSDSR